MLILDLVGAEVFQKCHFLGAKRVAAGLHKTICCLFPSCITGRMAGSGGVPSREEKDEACSNKAMRWNRLHMLLSEAIRAAVFCCLTYLFARKRKMFERWRSGRGLTHKKPHTQTHGQGSGRRSNGPELSPFGPRTSEVPLCAALHLFYPSSLIRPGRPRDPGARVTCQLTVYS